MTLIFNDGVGSSLNQTPATPAEAMFLLKRLLKQVGWTVPKSSDGTTYNSGDDQISSGATGANGMDNAYAWFVVKQPGSNRSFCCQRTGTTGVNSSRSWRIKYSKAAGFSAGSPSITQTPSATDEVVVLGTGTDASPGFTIMFFYGDGDFRLNCCADNAAPYGFISWSWQRTSGLTGHAFGLDPVIAYATGDADPYVVHLVWNPTFDVAFSKNTIGYSGSGYGQLGCWAGNTWIKSTNGYTPNTYAGVPWPHSTYDPWSGTGDNPVTGNDDIMPLTAMAVFQTSVSPYYYYKGILTLTRAVLQPGRYCGDLYSISSSKDGVCVKNCVLPWDGSSTPLV